MEVFVSKIFRKWQDASVWKKADIYMYKKWIFFIFLLRLLSWKLQNIFISVWRDCIYREISLGWGYHTDNQSRKSIRNCLLSGDHSEGCTCISVSRIFQAILLHSQLEMYMVSRLTHFMCWFRLRTLPALGHSMFAKQNDEVACRFHLRQWLHNLVLSL